MPKVIIIGGGVAGLSAAHELIERGFQVEVYESSATHLGGKARSENVTGTGPNFLSGEHGFRFFPGFYRHMTNTLSRIPYGSSNCLNNLVKTKDIMFARPGLDPMIVRTAFPVSASDLNIIFRTLTGGIANTGLTSAETTFFKNKLFQLLTSCPDRFESEYENIGWWQFLEADRFSTNYQSLLVDGLSRSLVAAKAKTMNTRVGGSIFLQLIFCMADPAFPPSRVFNGPTNEKWLDPWVTYLTSKGVDFKLNHEALALNPSGNTISSIIVKNKNNNTNISASGDFYLVAVPIEKAVNLLVPTISTLDPSLNTLTSLSTDTHWMNGIQYYLNVELPINKGHFICVDSPWSVTGISQIQYWPGYPISSKHDGSVRGILSIDISNWEDGIYNGKLAKDCTDQEIAEWTYAQMQERLIIGGIPILDPVMNNIVEKYHIGSSLTRSGPVLVNAEPLLVNKVHATDLMPRSFTAVKNLFLASDYVRTNTGLATMEAANESARRAINDIIDKSGIGKPYAKVWKLREWNMVLPLKWWDKTRFRKGLPYAANYPWWLRIIAFIWTIICLIAWVFKYLFHRLFGW